MAKEPPDITELLRLALAGDQEAMAKVLAELYGNLHRRALRVLASERRDHSLQATALIHEFYLRTTQGAPVSLVNRLHFLRLASQVMRQILVDHARTRRCAKRGGLLHRLPLEHAVVLTPENCDSVLMIDMALDRLTELDERQAQIVEMRFFGGLSEEEIAEALGISKTTVKRDWRMARSWLHAELAA